MGAVGPDLLHCFVDAIEVARAAREGMEALATERLRALAASFAGDVLNELEIERQPAFNGWLVSRRRRFRGRRAALLEHFAGRCRVDDLVTAMQPMPEGEKLFRKSTNCIGFA